MANWIKMGTYANITYSLDTISNFFRVGYETTFTAIENHHFFTKTCHRQTYQNY